MSRDSGVLAAIRRHWRPALVTLLATVGVTLGIALATPRTYRSTATIFISNRDLSGALTGLGGITDTSRTAATDVQLAGLDSVIDPAKQSIAAVGAESGRTASVQLRVPSSANADGGNLLQVLADSRDPEYSRNLATAVAKRYVTFRLELNTRQIRRAEDDVAQRLSELRSRGGQGTADYADLSRRLQTLQTLELLSGGSVEVAEAGNAARRVGPQPQRATVQGLLVGLVLAVIVALGLQRVDLGVRSADEIQKELDLPLLARLPRRGRGRTEPSLVVTTQPTGTLAESLRGLYLHVRLALLSHSGRRMLVTSAAPGEGKSFTAANLGFMAAMAGEDVLLVDLDLRRPTLHRYFGREASPGVTEVLTGDVDLEHAIHWVDVGRLGTHDDAGHGELRVLFSGRAVPNPGELLASEAMARLLQSLPITERTWVIVDTAPVLAVSDASALAGHLDTTLVVCNSRQSTRRQVQSLREALTQGGHRVLGLVVSGSQEKSHRYATYYDATRQSTPGLPMSESDDPSLEGEGSKQGLAGNRSPRGDV